jgi:hypothetical protein
MQISHPRTTDHVQEDSFGLRCVLVLVALLEVIEAVLDLPLIVDRPNLLYGPWAEMPTSPLGVFLAKGHVVVHPLLAFAALTLSVVGNIRGSLVALGAISVVTWLSFLPVVLRDGLPLQDGWAVQWTIAQLLVFPVVAGMAIALAVLTSLHRLAVVLIAIPTAYNAFGMVLLIINIFVANM